MTTYVLRVWLPDRPGALGHVASRIGAVGGDLVGIDILERGAGRAIDELVVDLPDDDLLGLMCSEIGQVEGVDVEDVRTVADALRDPRLDALETARDHDLVAVDLAAPFDDLYRTWTGLTLAMNDLARSMGVADLYPFAPPPAAVEKVRFVLDLARERS